MGINSKAAAKSRMRPSVRGERGNRMKKAQPKGIFWRILFALAVLAAAAVLELGKHTVAGWILAAVLFAAYYFLRSKKWKGWKAGKKLLVQFGMLAGAAAVLWISWPPVQPVPAVKGKSAGTTGVVRVAQGSLTGVLTEDGQVEVYAGIPYAQPPVGSLRWKEPRPALPWDGVLKADHFAPMSMQTRNLPLYDSLVRIIGYHDYEISLDDNYREPASEDSLYLNIWKPAGSAEKLPVLVYVHGGSLQTGQPWYGDYSGEGLARKGVVVVNMGYRLGVFGFFADRSLAEESPNGTTGNYGLLDQICALEWVRDNIAAFGGDPENVTLAGESAGSACVTALCTSPLAKGLFRRVIAESSTVTAREPAHSFRSMEDALKAGAETKARFGAETAEDLRQVPAEKIAGELAAHHHITVDGYVLAETPFESYEEGSYNEEARLHGFNREEAEAFILFSQANLKDYESKVRLLFPREADKVLALYPAATDAEAKRNWADIYSAFFFSYGHSVWERQAAAHRIPSYEYLFTRENGRLGNWHSGEEVYFYGNIPDHSGLYTADDRELSETMQQYFVNFIRTGNPNGEGLPEWPAGTGAEGRVLVLDRAIRLEADPFAGLYPILDEEQREEPAERRRSNEE